MADNCLLEVLFCLVSGTPYSSGFPPTNSCYWRFLACFSSLHPLYYWDYPGLSCWSTALSFFGSMHFKISVYPHLYYINMKNQWLPKYISWHLIWIPHSYIQLSTHHLCLDICTACVIQAALKKKSQNLNQWVTIIELCLVSYIKYIQVRCFWWVIYFVL